MWKNISTVRRRIIVALVTCLAVGLSAVAPPAATTSAVGCYGAGCTGKDPQANCSSSPVATRESKSFSNGLFTIQLRYSAACGAFWARGYRGDAHQIPSWSVHLVEE